MERKELGKIKNVYAGFCGYQQAQFGFQFTLGGEDGWGVSTEAYAAWGMEPSDSSEWTKEDQIKQWGESMEKLRDIMEAAKVKDVTDLVGIPVEATFEDMRLTSWRILAEVL